MPASRSAYDELTHALATMLLGGQTPEAVEQGQMVRPGYGLGTATSVSTSKSALEPTLAPGEWEQMTPDQHRERLLKGLADIAFGAGSALGAPAEMPGVGGGGVRAPRVAASGSRTRPGVAGVEPGGQLPPSSELTNALAEMGFGAEAPAAPAQKAAQGAAQRGVRQPRQSTVTIEPRINDPLANNASAESGSGGSVEAINRIASLAAKGQRQVRISPSGEVVPSNEDGGIGLQKGWKFGYMDKDGNFTLLDQK